LIGTRAICADPKSTTRGNAESCMHICQARKSTLLSSMQNSLLLITVKKACI